MFFNFVLAISDIVTTLPSSIFALFCSNHLLIKMHYYYHFFFFLSSFLSINTNVSTHTASSSSIISTSLFDLLPWQVFSSNFVFFCLFKDTTFPTTISFRVACNIFFSAVTWLEFELWACLEILCLILIWKFVWFEKKNSRDFELFKFLS